MDVAVFSSGWFLPEMGPSIPTVVNFHKAKKNGGWLGGRSSTKVTPSLHHVLRDFTRRLFWWIITVPEALFFLKLN
jgi:hypothetical protein